MIVDQDHFRLLKSNSLFKGVSEATIKHINKPKNFVKVQEGKLIYGSDEELLKLYLIVEGEVKIKNCESRNVEQKYLFDFFGEPEILNKTKRTSSAVANVDCVLFELSEIELDFLMMTNDTIKKNLLKNGESDTNIIERAYVPNENPNPEVVINEDKSENFLVNQLEEEKEESIELSDEELDNIVEKQKSKQKLADELKRATNITDDTELKNQTLDDEDLPEDWNFSLEDN
jgi:signal-transduction protein with cAMP-binding, CBS, and nucleotidyltransferase domain